MNRMRIVETQLRLNGPRHQFQVGPTRFSIVQQNGQTWLREDYMVLDRYCEKDDQTDWHGPFTQDEFDKLDLSKARTEGKLK